MFDSNGNLPAGFHDWDLVTIKDNLVNAFPSSISRPGIMNGYEKLRQALAQTKLAFEHWLDGSFSTFKDDPADLDLLTLADVAAINALPLSQQQQLRLLFAGKQTRLTHSCDSYFLPTVPTSDPNHEFLRQKRKYWMGEFGFDRADNPKGIVRTSF